MAEAAQLPGRPERRQEQPGRQGTASRKSPRRPRNASGSARSGSRSFRRAQLQEVARKLQADEEKIDAELANLKIVQEKTADAR